MKRTIQLLKPLFVPLLVAAASGLAVAVLTGALKIDDIKGWLNLDSTLVSPQGKISDQDVAQETIRGKEKTDDQGTGSQYTALFLTNGQVYFGKLEKADSQEPVLSDIFYLRARRQLQPTEEDETAEDDEEVRAAQTIKTEFTLVKFGAELHGPTDRIELNRDYILFWEPLRVDSKVVQAIETYYAQQ